MKSMNAARALVKNPKFYANLNRKANNNMKLWTKFKTLIYKG